MINVRNTQRSIFIDVPKIQKQAQKMLDVLGYNDFDLGIWFTTNASIKKYNAQYRHKDKATDILSFPFHALKPGERIIPTSDDEKNLGDLIIAPKYVQETLAEWGNTFEKRLSILLAHGIAHLLGYDHETDEQFKQMNTVEKKLLKAL